MDREKKELLVVVSWAVWNARNDRVWKNKVQSVDSIISSVKGFLNAQSAGFELSSSSLIHGDGAEHWAAPQEHSVKVNVDTAVFGETRQFRIGLVARDAQGLLIEGRTKIFQGHSSPKFIEAMGIRQALSWIKARHWQKVVLETDCLSVVQALRSSIFMISTFGQVVNDCKAMLNVLKNVSIYFVRRSTNMVAHKFARASVSFPDCIFSLKSVPTDLLPGLVTEMVI
ncbi:hypothetical protein CsatB_007911 [Cannabis sativa]